MKRTLIFSGILIVLVVLVLLKIFSDKEKKQHEKSTGKDPVIPVEIFVAKDTTVEYQFTTVGTIRANESVAIVSEINRKIIHIFLKEGSFVAKGQLLFKLDDADIVARINKLKVEQQLASESEAREKALLAKGGISRERFDIVSNNLNKLNAEIAVLEVDLGKTEIRAPFAGKIGLRNVSEGAMVNPEVVLAMLHDISQVKIDFAIPERYANDLRAGARVTFTTDYSTEIFNSVVEAVEPAVDFNTRTILLRSVADNRQGKLVAGSSVKVNLDIRAFDKSLFIPTSALIPSIKGYTVFLIKSGKAVSQVVKTGIRNKSSIQVLEGLALGDTLVTTNLLRVKKDVPLKIINAP